MSQNIVVRKLFQRRQHRGAAEGVRTPRIGRLAIIEAGKQIRAPHRRRDWHAVAQAFAEDHHVRFQAVGFIRKQVAGAAEIRLHLVENKGNVIFAAKLLEQLQVSPWGVVRSAATEVRLGDQDA